MGIMYKADERGTGKRPLTWTGVFVIVLAISALGVACAYLGAR